MCGEQLKQKKVKDMMLMLGFSEAMDQLALGGCVHLCGHV